MKVKRVLLIMTFMLLLIVFSGGQPTTASPNTATPNTIELTEECKAEIKAVLQGCAQQCGRNLRCFIRCVTANYPSCAL